MICTKCETEFERSHPAQKYCNECRGKTTKKICKGCDTEFELPYGQYQDFCSLACRQAVAIRPQPDTQLQEGYAEAAEAVGLPPDPLSVSEDPLGPLDVYSPERWSSLLENGYEFDVELGRARCKEMSSNIALPSPGDPAYVETPSGEDMLTFNDLPLSDRFVIERESNPAEPERTREVMIETALSYHRLFGKAHAHEFGGK